MLKPLAIFLSSIVISFFITYPTIWVLNFFHIGQPVREEGPSAHRSKAGTITMGGIGFILSIIILSFVLVDFEFTPQYLAILLLFIAFALIGFLDDLLKILRGKNLGLTFWQKIFAQLLAASVFAGFVM
ncbi:MAG: phospho-N-acetylmuramoyl-pentapeptide-transferase, partial [Candidatus Margulisiibacteriota bacterium]